MAGRQFWVIVHRWAGLTIAAFLLVAGATGALLPFNHELTSLGAPWRHVVPPSPGARLLDPVTLWERAVRAEPDADVQALRLNQQPGQAFDYSLTAKPGRTLDHGYVSLDPYTGRVLHRGTWARLADGVGELMPFLYLVHYSFAIGPWGNLAFGIAALVWTLDCLVGFYLTLPISRRRWWGNWRRAWRVRGGGSGYRLNVDLHRAGGLWFWPLLFVFAWSSVGMNLPQVYAPVMAAVAGSGPAIAPRPMPAGYVPDWRASYAQARRAAAIEGRRLGFTVVSEHSLFWDEATGNYSYAFTSSRDVTDTGGWSGLTFRPSGDILAVSLNDGRIGEGGLGNWLMALHVAEVGGLPYRILVSILGLTIVALSVTGVVIWMKKRSARLLHGARARDRREAAI